MNTLNDYFWKFLKVRPESYRLSPTTSFPLVDPLDENFEPPTQLVDFKQALTRLKREEGPVGFGVHFYMRDDYLEQFNRNFDKYVDELKRARCVLTPDYSIVHGMTPIEKMNAISQSRKFGQLMQEAGVTVVTTLQWGDPETFGYCFADVPKNNVVSISTVGIAKLKAGSPGREFFRLGCQEAVEQLKPRLILLYGSLTPECEFGDTPYRVYPNSHYPRGLKGKEVVNG